MAKLGISTGTIPNDGTGDSLLSGAIKINSNFTELYTTIGDGSTLSTPVTSLTAGDNITVSGSTGAVTISGIGTADIDTDRINVSGVVTASSFSGSGANLTSLNATQLGSGTIPDARFPSSLPAIDGSALTGIVAAGAGVTVQDSGSSKGTASILNFGSNLSVTDVGSGIVTVTASGGVADTSNVRSNTLVVTGVSTLGVVTGATYYGDGSALTGIATFSGNYNDLTNTPTIPTNNNQLTNGAGYITTSFTNTNQLTNGAGYITTSFTNTNQLTNGAGFITASDDITGNAGTASTAGIATYTSEWTLGADGTNNYTFTGPGLTGAENDPTLYLTRGQQYKITNNMGSHPFRIQSTPNGSTGTQYNDGITNNDVSNGTLTWDVQFDAPNILYYQCTSHPNMGGPIYIVPRSEPAVGVRTEVSGTTGSVGAAATTNLDITGFKSYGLLKVGISSAAWVRLYVDGASRTSDANRSYLVDPTPGSGLIAEVRTETAGISTFLLSPGIIGWNNDVSVGSTIYTAVTNNESSSATITVDLTVVKMED
jgi:hypothetical protein